MQTEKSTDKYILNSKVDILPQGTVYVKNNAWYVPESIPGYAVADYPDEWWIREKDIINLATKIK
jgi:hypothetical protein